MLKKILSWVLIVTIFAWNSLVYVPLAWAEEVPPSSDSVVTQAQQQEPPAAPSTSDEDLPPEVQVTDTSSDASASPAPEPTVETTPEPTSSPAPAQEQIFLTEQPTVAPTEALTPTLTPTPDINSNAQITDDITSTANTGDNTIDKLTPTPTPAEESTAQISPSSSTDEVTPSDTPSPAPDASPTEEQEPLLASLPNPTEQPMTDAASTLGDSLQIENTCEATNSAQSVADTGNNLAVPAVSEEQSGDHFPVDNRTATVQTGDADSIVIVDNSINSSSVNSNVIYQTINIFNTQSGPLDLSTPYAIVNDILNNDAKKNEPIVNVSVASVNNYAYLSNTIVSTANTGGNMLMTPGNATVNTGDAYSVVTLLNKVNVTLIDSTIHLITINIFGELDGDIILPELAQSVSCASGCGAITAGSVTNNADLVTAVDSQATSGENTATVKRDGDISTGNATSVVNVDNLVNTTLSGVVFYNLNIQTFGEWAGQFLGWDMFAPSSDKNIIVTGTTPGDGSDLGNSGVVNTATVSNNIFSSATSGDNIAQGRNVSIATGNSYSSVSVFNIINTTLHNAVGFFSFVNIFGKWTGDIGGESKFLAQDPDIDPNIDTSDQEESQDENQDETIIVAAADDEGQSQREEGGKLEILQTNNVGEHVLPGDTVTFFITVRNTGTGTVYDSELYLFLLKDGVDVGGTLFNLGNIPGGRGARITTGLVLSGSASAGEYIARAEVTGSVGQDNSQILSTSDSTFIIKEVGVAAYAVAEQPVITSLSPAVLGAKNLIKSSPKNYLSAQLFSLLPLLLMALYLEIRLQRKKRQALLVERIEGRSVYQSKNIV